MATLDTRNFSSDFSGLLVTVELSLGVLAIGLIVHEVIRRRKRDTIYWRTKGKVGQETSEEWSFGYLYHCRSFVAGPRTPMETKWPLSWALQSFWRSEAWYAEHAGLDAAVYVRYLRACFYFVLAHFLTTFPSLLALHLSNSSPEIAANDIARASLSSLILTDHGISLLYVHLILLYWLCFSWAGAIIWVGWGHLRLRRAHLAQLAESRGDIKLGPRAGWRFRTIVVTNIPGDLDLRDEGKLVEYFEDGLRAAPANEHDEVPVHHHHHASPQPKMAHSPTLNRAGRSDMITKVVLVRKVAELHEQVAQRTEALHQLETAHAQLAKNVLHAVEAHRKLQQKASNEKVSDLEKSDVIEQIADALAPYLDSERVDYDKSLWEVLRSLPREYLDAYQPLHKLRKVFKKQKVPAIDYWTTKLNLVNALIDDLRSRPDLIAPSSTAFVTFEQASDARRACRFMPTHPNRLWACKVRMAPDTRDIIWPKLARVTFKGDLVRSIVVQGAIWFVTIIWVLPISLFLAALSLDNIANRVPALANYLNNHSSQKALLSSFLPTLLVTILSFLIPTILNQISMRAQNFYTVSKLHSRILSRYWVWLVTNVVVLFCAGSSVVKAIFTDISAAFVADDLLKRIAQAFPAGAVFFVGWQLLTLGIHHGFEIMLLGFPWINHQGVRHAGSARKRMEAATPRMFQRYYWTLVLSIVYIFALLNPLVIGFGFIYFSLSVLVFKSQLAHVYYRRHWEDNGRLYVRFMRFSLDTIMLTEVIMMAFFWVLSLNGYGGACIALLVVTAMFKLVLTRWFKAHMDALDISEASIYTGAAFEEAKDTIDIPILPAFLRRMPLFARFRIRLPAARLHRPRRLASTKPSPVLQQNGGAFMLRERDPRDSLASDRERLMRAASAMTAESPTTDDSAEGERTLVNCGAEEMERKVSQRPTALPPLVTPHPSLVRDDRPNYDAGYDDPCLIEPLDHSLWLPRDPLYPIDLNDTVDYRGPAIVSSAGGSGRLGLWDEPAVEEPMLAVPTVIAEDVLAGSDKPSSLVPTPRRPTTASSLSAPASDHERARPTTSPTSGLTRKASSALALGATERLHGTERIAVAEEVAARLEEGEDDSAARKAWRSFSAATSGRSPRSPSSTVSSPLRRPRSSTLHGHGPIATSPPGITRRPSSRLSSGAPQPASSGTTGAQPTHAASLSPPRPQSGSEAGGESYFPPPQRLPSTFRRTASRQSFSGTVVTAANGVRIVSQADALREEVLAEERERAAVRQKEEMHRREEEQRAEEKAATKARRKSSVSRRSDGTPARPSWLARRIADLTTP